MIFKVLPYKSRLPSGAKDVVFLLTDGWDDWFKFATMYNVIYFDGEGEQHRIGEVKIGQFNMADDQRSPNIPEEFEQLSDEFFSLGQDDSYYQTLKDLGEEVLDMVLIALRDVAKDAELYERALKEKVTGISLLRSVSDTSVRGQFRRIANGGARLTPYSFSYTPPDTMRRWTPPPTFNFDVVPKSSPSTNVHVLIGRNGVGKTYTVNLMTRAVVEPQSEPTSSGIFKINGTVGAPSEMDVERNIFPNIVSVTFSAFDPFEPLPTRENKASGVRYHYIGLKHIAKGEDGNPKPPKSPDDLATDFGNGVQLIVTQYSMRERWRRALSLLESDPIFKLAEVWRLIDEYEELKETLDDRRELSAAIRKSARKLFSKLSSGHKIVLLTITRLVETVAERSLVLLDEPEAHLHPPLLASLIHSLSDLLVNRNGVAIIATHSPVILQEVPRTCVWRIRRSGRQVAVERPEIETFGENVGTLTSSIFGLEVTDSGFHKVLSDAIDEGLDYDGILNRFNGQLGDEGRAIARSLIATRLVDGG
ncbi:MAG: AAA family ATPase [Methylococcus sp.]